MKTYVLYRPERLARVTQTLAEAGFTDYELVLGPDGDTFDPRPYRAIIPATSHLSRRMQACLVGHYGIACRAAEAGEMALVLEDDFVPAVTDWKAALGALLSWADRDWDYLNLGRYFDRGGVEVWPGVVDSFSLCSHAYLLSPEGAKRYRDHFAEGGADAIDWIPQNLKREGKLLVYTASPRLFRQDRANNPPLCNVDQPAEPVEFWAWTGLADEYGRIPGWFHFRDAYQQIVTSLPYDEKTVFVELGAWKGRSTHYLASEILRSGKPVYLYVIDAWADPGVEGDGLDPASEEDKAAGSIRACFDRNLRGLSGRLGERMTVYQNDTVAQSSHFSDESVDVVWVDANHTYEGVKRDLASWWPKLAVGGVMGGDDWAWETVRRAVSQRFGDAVRSYGEYPWWVVRKGDDGEPEAV